jgi:hypothetical protein
METGKMPHNWQRDHKNVVFTHNGILFSHKEGWNFIIRKWMELENIILSEVSQAKKAKNRMFSFICEL